MSLEPIGVEPFEQAARELANRIREWEAASASEPYVAQLKVTDRITESFIEGVRSANLVFTRYPDAEN